MLIASCFVQPTWPFGKNRLNRAPPPFFGVDARPGLVVVVLMGLQHALAMLGGIIAAPLLVYRQSVPDVRALSKLALSRTWNHLPCVLLQWACTKPH